MIDLDSLDESSDEEELYLHFGVLLCSDRLIYQDWQYCTENLGIKKYVFPDSRELYEELLDEAYKKHKKDSTALMRQALLMSHIEAHYTITQQIKIFQIMKGRKGTMIEKSPENCAILDSIL